MNRASVRVNIYRNSPAFTVGRFAYEPDVASNVPGIGRLTMNSDSFLTPQNARVEFELALGIFQLVITGQFDAYFSHLRIDNEADGSRQALQTISASGTFIGPPISTNELAALELGLTTFNGNAINVDRDRLERSVRWYRMATSETDQLQKFIMAWIALESLYRLDDSEGTNTSGIHQQMEVMYDREVAKQKSRRIGEVYRLRIDIVHHASLGEAKIFDAARDTLAILRDCLRYELHLIGLCQW